MNSTEIKRSFFYLPLLDRYILVEFLIPFIALTVGFTFLFLVGELLDDLQDFIEAQASFSTTAHYFLLKLPENFRFILPISTLLSGIYAMANMGKNNEITALRASGISLLRCGGSLYIFSLILTLISFTFNETVIPGAIKQAHKIKCKVKNRPYNELRWLSYFNQSSQRLWLFDKFSLEGEQENVYIKQLCPEDKSTEWEIKAERAQFNEKTGWRLENVLKMTFDPKGEFVVKTENLPILKLTREELDETPETILQGTESNNDLPFMVIWNKLKTAKFLPEKQVDTIKTILYNRVALPWACFISVLIAIPLATKSNRNGVFGFIIKAIVIIVVYQLIAQICVVLGKGGMLNPLVAGIGPTIGLLVFALYQIKNS